MRTYDANKVGKKGEKYAARYLKKQHCRILARNYRAGRNELDLVVRDGKYIAFVEVKARAFDTAEQAALHRPSAAVNAQKRHRTVDAAYAYLRAHPTTLCPRLDVVEVWLDRSKRLKPFRIHHIPGAFSPNGRVR